MSEPRYIVSNTGPLISLEKLSRGYDVMRQLYDRIFIPPAVLDELAQDQFSTPEAYLKHYNLISWVEVKAISFTRDVPEAERLDEGEVQAIRLALELGLPLLIEETIGRRVAQGLGLHISGIAGQILKAFRSQIVGASEAEYMLQELLRTGRINTRIYEALAVEIRTA